MARINTVLGQISDEELGLTLMHEHLTLAYPGWDCDAFAAPYDRQATADACVSALSKAKAHGVKTIVDAAPNDLGRDVELQKMVSGRLGMNIICATGMYTESQGKPGYLKFRKPMFDIATELYETFMKEITQGIGNTGVRAGVIKVATGYEKISRYEGIVLKAAARAQKDTGVPIITHTESGTMGPEQAGLLLSEGAEPKRLMVGHMCGNANLQYHLAVLDKGVYIAFDRFGINSLVPDALRKACLVGLLGLGHAGRIMLSHDYAACWLGRPSPLPEPARALLADWSHIHIFDNILPALKKAGVSNEQIHTMMVDNPRRLFAA